MPAITVLIKVAVDSKALAKEIAAHAAETFGQEWKTVVSTQVSGLVMERKGREFKFTFRGLTVRYFLRHDRTAVILGSSSKFGFHPVPVQGVIDAQLAAYADRMDLAASA